MRAETESLLLKYPWAALRILWVKLELHQTRFSIETNKPTLEHEKAPMLRRERSRLLAGFVLVNLLTKDSSIGGVGQDARLT